jgi:hypothetical protein
LTGLGSHEVWKVFAAAKGYGERGGARVIYVGILYHDEICLLPAYQENDMVKRADQQE